MKDGLRRLVGNVFMVGFSGPHMDSHVRVLMEKHYVSNFILFRRNLVGGMQVRQLTQQLRAYGTYCGIGPLWIATDQENGIVRRLPDDLAPFPGNMAVAATDDPKEAYHIGRATADALVSMGINVNLAPVVDIHTNPHNPVIGARSYGDRPEWVSKFGTAMALGMRDGKIVGCAKHFPGHGDTYLDSRRQLPIVWHDRSRLEAVELQPFRSLIAAGVGMIMTAHVALPSLTGSYCPATLSPAISTDLLRRDLKFNGVITTDCLQMEAITRIMDVPHAAVQALQSGADMLLVSHHFDQQLAAIEAVVGAVESGYLKRRRLEEAAARIHALKQDSSYHGAELNHPITPFSIGDYAKYVCVLANRKKLLPLGDATPHHRSINGYDLFLRSRSTCGRASALHASHSKILAHRSDRCCHGAA